MQDIIANIESGSRKDWNSEITYYYIHFRIFSVEEEAGARARLFGVQLRPGAVGKVHCEVEIAEAFGSHARASLGDALVQRLATL